MAKPKIDYTLYLVTDRQLMSSSTVEQCVEQGILGGCTVVQLREKSISARQFLDTAIKVREVTSRLGVPFIVNDRGDIAVAAEADGLHIGQGDITVQAARRVIGNDKILGVSVSDTEQALAAAEAGADYLGVGAMFATDTKTNAGITSMDELRQIRRLVDLPIAVIGGINKQTAPLFAGMGIDGIAVVSAIVAQKDVAGAAKEIKGLFQND